MQTVFDPNLIVSGDTFMRRSRTSPIATGWDTLDRATGGGLRPGELSEWGLPAGRGGRELILRLLAHAQHRSELGLLLWVLPDNELTVYPPAWEARGLDLARIFFATTSHVMHDLKPAFTEPVFDAIVLDTPKITQDDLAYMAGRARDNHNLTLVLRPYLLRSEKGNVWAKLRLNCWYDETRQEHQVHLLRGAPPCRVRIRTHDH